jgi:hypothetical protein
MYVAAAEQKNHTIFYAVENAKNPVIQVKNAFWKCTREARKKIDLDRRRSKKVGRE